MVNRKASNPVLLVFISIILFSIFGFVLPNSPNYSPPPLNTDLPWGYNELFAGSGECGFCHDNISTSSGKNVSITDHWRSSMMGNAAKDPLWRAKVSMETLVNPGHKAELEDLCTRCHTPTGHINAIHNGAQHYDITSLDNDPLARDGVSCTVCHQISPESIGKYSGTFLIGTEKTIWGPYSENLTQMPMFNHTGYTPEYGSHINESALCGSCHSLLTNTVDVNNQPTGTQFVEQAIYHEWKNSDFPSQGKSCSSCHLPRVTDPVILSERPPWLDTERSPFGQHHFVGANIFMMRMFKQQLETLGITAEESHMDSTMARTMRLLQNNTLDLELTEISRNAETLTMELLLENKAGHKFPAGFPSRRAFINFVVLNENLEIIFQSGKFDSEGRLVKSNLPYEPHHKVISEEQQVQIYEMVMGNSDLEVTTILERAYVPLKDNRLTPTGFLQSHVSYDTTLLAGNVLSDPDFNKENGIEGSGSDRIVYAIPLNGNNGNLSVIARVFYQTMPPEWLDDLFEYESPEIEVFHGYYEDADKSPIHIVTEMHESLAVSTGSIPFEQWKIFPNPGQDFVNILLPPNGPAILKFISTTGEEILKKEVLAGQKNLFQVRLDSGVYVAVLHQNEDMFIKRVIIF
jgi:hypothetical protein